MKQGCEIGHGVQAGPENSIPMIAIGGFSCGVSISSEIRCLLELVAIHSVKEIIRLWKQDQILNHPNTLFFLLDNKYYFHS